MNRVLTLSLGERSYPIHIGSGILQDEKLLLSAIRGTQVLFVSNENIATDYDYLPQLLQHCQQAGLQVAEYLLPDGEQHKNLQQAEAIFTRLLQCGFHRDCCIVAVGGGVVGDVSGFVAACYQRGVDFIQVPTTLLAQVDSAVGGKTAVNHPLGKNMIGAFHQPVAVLADINTLHTLPSRQRSAGLAEVIKYGLIGDAEFFAWLEEHAAALMAGDDSLWVYAVEHSCKSKARIVAQDEYENGVRALLNLGHTFGHAIESVQSYSGYLHGEAVACGMLMAAHLSMQYGWLSEQDVARLRNLLAQFKLPVYLPPAVTAKQLLARMQTDKKVKQGCLVLILLAAIGEARIVTDPPLQPLQDTISTFLATETEEIKNEC